MTSQQYRERSRRRNAGEIVRRRPSELAHGRWLPPEPSGAAHGCRPPVPQRSGLPGHTRHGRPLRGSGSLGEPRAPARTRPAAARQEPHAAARVLRVHRLRSLQRWHAHDHEAGSAGLSLRGEGPARGENERGEVHECVRPAIPGSGCHPETLKDWADAIESSAADAQLPPPAPSNSNRCGWSVISPAWTPIWPGRPIWCRRASSSQRTTCRPGSGYLLNARRSCSAWRTCLKAWRSRRRGRWLPRAPPSGPKTWT